MNTFKGLRQASHFGPTLIVTAIAFAFGNYYWWEGTAYIIAITVALGQLVVGWSNDLYDYKDDLAHGRSNKRLVSGLITPQYLTKWLRFMVPFSFIANLLGPLGVKGGLIYLFGVGMGVSYNFYFKSTSLSPLPYALAFAALVSSIVLATDRVPPLWLIAAGSLLGIAAHFANVLKDLDEDLESGIKGLPQMLGKFYSRLIVSGLLVLTTVLLHLVNPNPPLLVGGLAAALITSFAPDNLIFKFLMVTVVIDLILLLSAADSTIGSLVI